MYKSLRKKRKSGFSLIELLVVIAIIGVLGSIVLSAVNGARTKARDAKRKAEISSIGRLITASCYLPTNGAGEYDIVDLVDELVATNPQYAKYLSQIPKDPSVSDSAPISNYNYIVDTNSKCAVYANLENENEAITLQNISSPTAGGGTGVLNSSTEGPNGSTKYFQVSN